MCGNEIDDEYQESKYADNIIRSWQIRIYHADYEWIDTRVDIIKTK